MLSPRYRGLKIAPSYSAMRELMKQGKTLDDVVEVLEAGQNAPRKRGPGSIEKWLNKGDKTFNAVIVKDYNATLKQDVWLLVHFGRFSRRKIR
jgi:hypothetical protein